MHLFSGRNEEYVDSGVPLINTVGINNIPARPLPAA